MIREASASKVIFDWRPEISEMNHEPPWGMSISVREKESAKVSRRENIWHVCRPVRRPVWLELSG